MKILLLNEHKLESEIMLKTLLHTKAKYREHPNGQIWDNLVPKYLSTVINYKPLRKKFIWL